MGLNTILRVKSFIDHPKRLLPLITVVVKQNQVRLFDRKPAVDPP